MAQRALACSWLVGLAWISACANSDAVAPGGNTFIDSAVTTPQNDAGTGGGGGSLDAASGGSGTPGGGAVDSGQTGPDGGSNDAGGGSSTQDGSAATPDAGAPDSGSSVADGGAPGTFEACQAALKPKCTYDSKETPCASSMTPKIPLSNGMTSGDLELKGGPYGAYVEWNEGKAFANPVNFLEATCDIVAGTFGEPPPVTADVLNLRGQDLALYTVFRPACFKQGEKYPVITWGNGTCGQSGGYGGLLATVASYGFVVIASNSRFTDAGNKEMLRALDFAKALNEDMTSPLFGKLDLAKVGAMGHSQGGSATRNAASDPRIKSVILWNGGNDAVKPFLAISGERDIGDPTPATMASAVNAAAQPGGWMFLHKVLVTGGNFTGHLTLMMQPERVVDVTVAWWRYQLNGDAEAKKMFVGSDCGFCNKKDEYEYGQKSLP
jgi:hypothetical protein